LVVIAIIAILAAILFPVFARARAKARQIACLNNVKQISLALMMYAQDNDETYPVVDHLAGYYWWDALQPYVKNAQVFRCPAYRATTPPEPPTDYLLNGLFAHGLSMAAIERPAEQISIAVRQPGQIYWGYHPWPDDGSSWDDLAQYSSFVAIAKDIHNGGSNYGFADGHAKWYRWESTIQPPLPGLHNVQRIIP
jgi:prepilin-type processing-associated H-X9-DG protein